MAEALAMAHQARNLDKVPVGAIIVREGKTICRGFNQPISTHDSIAHAEIMALRDEVISYGKRLIED